MPRTRLPRKPNDRGIKFVQLQTVSGVLTVSQTIPRAVLKAEKPNSMYGISNLKSNKPMFDLNSLVDHKDHDK